MGVHGVIERMGGVLQRANGPYTDTVFFIFQGGGREVQSSDDCVAMSLAKSGIWKGQARGTF